MAFLELKIPPVLQVIVIAGLMAMLSRYTATMALNPLLQWGGTLACLLLGTTCCVLGVFEFRRHETTVDPRFPDKASSLVDTGIYRITRNPMYVGFALWLMALVIYLGSPVLLLGVLVFVGYMAVFQIMPEERYLLTVFGDDFALYTQRVRRWL